MKRMKPWLVIRQQGELTIVHLHVPLGGGQFVTFSARVDNRKVLAALRRAGIDVQVAGLFGDIWKGVRKVARATGVSKVLSIATKVLKSPILQAVIPGAPLATRALGIAAHMVVARKAAAKGDPRAKEALRRAGELAAGRDPLARMARTQADQLYRIVAVT